MLLAGIGRVDSKEIAFAIYQLTVEVGRDVIFLPEISTNQGEVAKEMQVYE